MEIDIPKQVLEYDESDEIDDRPIVRTVYGCPNPDCNMIRLIPYESMCPKCGQILRWSGIGGL